MVKRKHPVPTDEEILSYDNVPAVIAARYIGWSTGTLYAAMKVMATPFAIPAKLSEHSFNISPGLLVAYKRGTLNIQVNVNQA